MLTVILIGYLLNAVALLHAAIFPAPLTDNESYIFLLKASLVPYLTGAGFLMALYNTYIKGER